LFLVFVPSAMAADTKVTGKVTVGGKPLVAGKVTLLLDNGQFVGSKVKDGESRIDHVPAGKYKVIIEGKDVPVAFTTEERTSLVTEVNDVAVNFDFNLN
jgi:hypothetical protein